MALWVSTYLLWLSGLDQCPTCVHFSEGRPSPSRNHQTELDRGVLGLSDSWNIADQNINKTYQYTKIWSLCQNRTTTTSKYHPHTYLILSDVVNAGDAVGLFSNILSSWDKVQLKTSQHLSTQPPWINKEAHNAIRYTTDHFEEKLSVFQLSKRS